MNWDAGLRFAFSFIAIIPLAKLLGEATEQMSFKLGQTISGLLNATFGNAVEIIVGIAALLQNELRIVQTSMLGSILSNLLLVLGCSFFFGGLKYPELRFNAQGALASSSLMMLAGITLVIPAAYHSSKLHEKEPFNQPDKLQRLMSFADAIENGGSPPDPDDSSKGGLLLISRGTAILLLLVYVAYLYFQLKSHANLFIAETEDDSEEEKAKMGIIPAAASLLTVTVITSFCADYLVASIEETAERYHIPKPFIGIVLLPLVANAAEHVTSVWMAMKGKCELTIGICVGSSIQIATGVIPLLVLVGWIAGKELTLFFADFETICLFVSVLLAQLVIMDGKSNYMEGLVLMTLYIVIGMAFWVS